MEEKNIEQNEVPKKKSNIGLIIIIISILIIGVGCFFLLTKSNSNDKGNKESNNNTENKEENKDNNIDKNDNEPIEPVEVDSTITKEEVETLLNELTPDSVRSNLLFEKTNDDESNFFRCIQYLVFNNKYTKDGEVFIFNKNDFVLAARKYFMRDNFDSFETLEHTKVTIDSETQTVKMEINFGLTDTGPEFTKEKEITSFEFENNIAKVLYNTKVIFKEPIENPDGSQITESITKYQIELIKVNNELRINNLSIIKD